MIVGKSWLVRADVSSIHIGLRQSRDTSGAVLTIATDVVVCSRSQSALGEMVDWNVKETKDDKLKESVEKTVNCLRVV